VEGNRQVISTLINARKSWVRFELALAFVVVLSLVCVNKASSQGGGTLAPGDPQITGVQCVTRCIGVAKGTVKSKVRLLGTDLAQTRVVSFSRLDGKRAKAKRPVVKPSGAVVVRVPKRAATGPVRLSDSFGQVRDSATVFEVGTKAELRQAQLAFRFPVRGPHSYGGAGSRFGAPRNGHTHQGQDVSAACGTPLIAPHGGVVKAKAYQASGAGHYVVIDGEGVKQDYVFMHLAAPAPVSPGQVLVTGQKIGKVGTTGSSTGCHLHFEIWVGKGWYSGGSPVDPLPTLQYWDSYS
jgi:murein DD-endopeptidase MepM/ murein hydrolase activator NlpD